MSPTPEKSRSDSSSTEKFKEILKSNGVHEPVAEVVVKDSGLTSEDFASSQKLVTIRFKNTNIKPLNLFMKTLIDLESHNQMITDLKSFEKEATFFMNYLSAATEFCSSMGYSELHIVYFSKFVNGTNN